MRDPEMTNPYYQIRIKKSPMADTRTCDFTKVTKEELLSSSKTHIEDVRLGMEYFRQKLFSAGVVHDHTKLTAIDDFFNDFKDGFKVQKWYSMHKAKERHHLAAEDGIRADVNLVDVLEYITDCVMAGKARVGKVHDLYINPDVLMLAFENTWRELAEDVEVEE